MTDKEIWEHQRRARAHMEAVPGCLGAAKQALEIVPPSHHVVSLSHATLATLVAEIERLQALVKQLRADVRDEQLEGQHAASAAFAEGRQEGRGERE